MKKSNIRDGKSERLNTGKKSEDGDIGNLSRQIGLRPGDLTGWRRKGELKAAIKFEIAEGLTVEQLKKSEVAVETVPSPSTFSSDQLLHNPSSHDISERETGTHTNDKSSPSSKDKGDRGLQNEVDDRRKHNRDKNQDQKFQTEDLRKRGVDGEIEDEIEDDTESSGHEE